MCVLLFYYSTDDVCGALAFIIVTISSSAQGDWVITSCIEAVSSQEKQGEKS